VEGAGVVGTQSEVVSGVEGSSRAKDSHVRSLLKALSWRVVATLTTSLIAYFIVGDITTAVTIGSIEFVLKFFIYYAHERAWTLVPTRSS